MPSTDRKLELKSKTPVAQTASQAAVYAKGLKGDLYIYHIGYLDFVCTPASKVRNSCFTTRPTTLEQHRIA
jgi:hypothetical protein